MSQKTLDAIAKREKARAADTARAVKKAAPPAPAATKPAAKPKAQSGT